MVAISLTAMRLPKAACMHDYTGCFGALQCPYEFACGDHFDNGANGLTDKDDPTCL